MRIVATELKGMYFTKNVTTTNKIFANLYLPRAASHSVHCNGHFINLAFGMPYLPNRLKMFLHNLTREGKLITTTVGAPDIDACKNTYPELYEQSQQDYIELNETYQASVQVEQQKGVIYPCSLWLSQKELLLKNANDQYQQLKKPGFENKNNYF